MVLVLDNLHTPAEIAYRVRDVANKFAGLMGPSDTMGVIMLSGGRGTTTSSVEAVRAAIKRFTPALGDSIRTPEQEAGDGLQAIAELTEQLSKSPHRRKVMVFIGSASIFSPSELSAFADPAEPALGDLRTSPRWFDAIRATARHNVTVYAIDPAGPARIIDGYTNTFAGETGGAAWVGTRNFNAAVARIMLESGFYYLLGYQAPINDYRLHKIEVRVNVPGLTVRARRGRG